MTDGANRHGSEIAGVRPECIEVLISAEKLRGTDFCVGAIDATQRIHQVGSWEGPQTTYFTKKKKFLHFC